MEDLCSNISIIAITQLLNSEVWQLYYLIREYAYHIIAKVPFGGL